MYSTVHLASALSSSASPPTSTSISGSTTAYASKVPYTTIILVEPALIDRQTYNAHFEDREGQISQVMKSVIKSRATWESQDEALTWLRKRYPWKAWESRVVELFVVRMNP